MGDIRLRHRLHTWRSQVFLQMWQFDSTSSSLTRKLPGATPSFHGRASCVGRTKIWPG